MLVVCGFIDFFADVCLSCLYNHGAVLDYMVFLALPTLDNFVMLCC